MAEVEHILFDESFLDLLVCPVDEKFIVKIGLLCETSRKEDGVLEVGAVPVSLQEDTKLLSSSESKDGNEDFASAIECFMDLLKELPFS